MVWIIGDVEVGFLDETETWERFENASQRLLGISGSEFVERFDAGRLEDLPNSDVMQVAILRPSAA